MNIINFFPFLLVFCISLNTINSSKLTITKTSFNRKDLSYHSQAEIHLKIKNFHLNGGEVISHGKEARKKSLIQNIREMIIGILPVTRTFILLSLFCTLLHLIIGKKAAALFALDWSKWYEIWRPFTSVAYLGGLSMSMANNLYFLISYGQLLEKEFGPGTHAFFLFLQVVSLTLLSTLMQFPFQAQSMISAIVYVCSRLHPMDSVQFQFGFQIKSWHLPYCMMVIDCLSQQSISPAWPHILGILTGHFYHFFTNVWPSLGGKFSLKTPNYFIQMFGDKPNSNISSLDFRKTKDRNAQTPKSSKKAKSRRF